MKYRQFLLLILLGMSLNATPTYAASDDECAIWICLPAGFVTSHCSAPRKEFLKRIKKLKPPLPPFHQCIKGGSTQVGGSVMTFRQGKAYWVPPETCSNPWGIPTHSSAPTPVNAFPGTSGSSYGSCVPHGGYWSTSASSCTLGPFCQTKNYIQIKMDGKDEGSPYYY
jgi:hypothetical protein